MLVWSDTSLRGDDEMGRLRPFALEVYFSLQTEYRFTSRYRQLDGRGIGDVAARTSCVFL